MKKTAAFLLIVMLMPQLMPMLSGFAEADEAKTPSQVAESVQTPAPTDEAEETAAPEVPTESAPPTETAVPSTNRPTQDPSALSEEEKTALEALLKTIQTDSFKNNTLNLRSVLPDDNFLWETLEEGHMNYRCGIPRNTSMKYYYKKDTYAPSGYRSSDTEMYRMLLTKLGEISLQKTTRKPSTDSDQNRIYSEFGLNFFTNHDVGESYLTVSLWFEDDIVTIGYELKDLSGKTIVHVADQTYIPNNIKTFKNYLTAFPSWKDIESFGQKKVQYDQYDPEKKVIHQPKGKGSFLNAWVSDRLSFNVTLDATYENTVLEDIAGANGPLQVTVEYLRLLETSFGREHYYGLTIATVKGSRGEMQFFNALGDNYNYTTGKPYVYVFDVKDRKYDGTFCTDISSVLGRAAHSVRIDRTDDRVTLTYKPSEYSPWLGTVTPSTLTGQNMKYEVFQTDSRYVEKIQSDGTVKTPLPTIDPEHYVTELRAEYDTHTADFFIDLAGHCKANTAAVRAPEWLKEIGGEESATVDFINICHTENGVYDPDSVDSPMFHITGEKGDKWFFISSGQVGQLPDGLGIVPLDNKTIYLSFHSCLSFNGTTIVRNSLEYDVLNTYFVFTNDDKTELDYILLEFGAGSRVKIPQKEISYLGDCNKTYEKWKMGA